MAERKAVSTQLPEDRHDLLPQGFYPCHLEELDFIANVLGEARRVKPVVARRI